MLRITLFLASLALGAAAAPASAQSVNDFQLQPSAPKPAPRAQGPVDEEGPALPTAPRVISTAAPRPAATATTAPPQAAPQQTPTTASATPAAPRPRTTVQPGPRITTTPGATPPPAVAATGPAPVVADPAIPAPDAAASAPVLTPTLSPTAPAIPTAAEAESGFPWLYAVLAALGLLALGGIALGLRARRAARPPAVIERPVLAAAPASALPLTEALTLRAEVLKVTRSFAFVTTDYRLTLVNRTGAAIGAFEVGADMVSAHASAPMDSQLAGPETIIEPRHSIERLGPNQTMRLEGQVRLPLGEAQVIRQGSTPLLVPLLRVRAARSGAAGGEALVKTLVVGQGTQGGGRVQPFNLTDTPRAYTEVAQRELA